MHEGNKSRNANSYFGKARFVLFFCQEWAFNMEKALKTFEWREKSDLHRASVVAVHNDETNLSVLAQMATGREAQMMKNRIVLSKIFTSLQYLGCQGVAVMGKFDRDSNLIALLEERKNDIMTSLN